MRLRRPALADVELSSHIFPVTYSAVDRQLPELLTQHRPQALLMFGLAARTSWVRVETRARNAVTMLWPDAGHTRVRKGSIAGGADAMMFGPHTARLLRAALGTGIDARTSRNAGSYLCNYLSWRAIEATCRDDGPAARRVHPRPAAGARGRLAKSQGRITLDELVDAGEAMLMEMVKLTRQVRGVGVARRRLTLPATIPLFRPRLHPARPYFCVTARACVGAADDAVAAGANGHGPQSPSSDRSIGYRRRRRAGRGAGCRACGAADVDARTRRHAIRCPARDP